MNFKYDEFEELKNTFTKTEDRIRRLKDQEDQETINIHEKNIIDAYNKIIKHTKDIWSSDNSKLKENIKLDLSPIYHRLKRNLELLKSSAKLPNSLAAEIKDEQRNDDKDPILQSQNIYDADIFNALLDEFDNWDRKITRKNASEKEDIVALRTKKIISAYNKLIDFANPIIQTNDERSTNKLRKELESRREFIKEDLGILNADIEVPQDTNQKIQTDDDDENKNTDNLNTNNDNSKKEIPTPQPNNDNDNKSMNNNHKNEIPLPLPLPSPSTTRKEDNKQTDIKPEPIKNTMTLTANDYYSMCSRQLNYTYDGDAVGLPPFIDSIELLQTMDEQKQFENILKGVIWSKLKGKAREYVPTNSTIDQIKEILKKNIKVPSSKIVTGKFMALKADRTNFTDYAAKAEELAEELKRAYISEEIPNERANLMTIEQTIELCASNTHSTQTKAVLEATPYEDAKEVIAKFIVQERKQSNTQQVLAFRGRNRNFQNQNRRFQNRYPNNNNNNYNRNNYRGRGFNRNNNYNRNQHNNRGNGNQNRNWRQNNNGNRQPRRGNVYYAENRDAPPPGAQQPQQVQLQQAEE